MRVTENIHGEGIVAPRVTQMCDRLALWPLLFPLIWTAFVLVRARSEPPFWEILIWAAMAILFCFWIGGGGLVAAFSPMVWV